jgi:hypothetical protein
MGSNTYGVYISQLIRYARARSNYSAIKIYSPETQETLNIRYRAKTDKTKKHNVRKLEMRNIH